MEELKLTKCLILEAIPKLSASEIKVMREMYPAVVVARAIDTKNPREKAKELNELFKELSEKYPYPVVARAIEAKNPGEKAKELNELFKELSEKYPGVVVARAIVDKNPREKAEELILEMAFEIGKQHIEVEGSYETEELLLIGAGLKDMELMEHLVSEFEKKGYIERLAKLIEEAKKIKDEVKDI
jgi:GTPase Era involved in 16S rRNA processing